jgi:hypothetical protein
VLAFGEAQNPEELEGLGRRLGVEAEAALSRGAEVGGCRAHASLTRRPAMILPAVTFFA